MNDLVELPAGWRPDERLLERLSRLRPFKPPESIDPGSEEKLLRDLRKRCLGKYGLMRSWQAEVGDYWQAVLVTILFFLLGWDLFRIIRLLLS